MGESDANPKTGALRVLHLDDNQDDSALIQAGLKLEWKGLELLRVETRATFITQLSGLDGRSALKIVRQAPSRSR